MIFGRTSTRYSFEKKPTVATLRQAQHNSVATVSAGRVARVGSFSKPSLVEVLPNIKIWR